MSTSPGGGLQCFFFVSEIVFLYPGSLFFSPGGGGEREEGGGGLERAGQLPAYFVPAACENGQTSKEIERRRKSTNIECRQTSKKHRKNRMSTEVNKNLRKSNVYGNRRTSSEK